MSYNSDAVLRTYDGMAPDYAVKYGSELADAEPGDPDLEFLDAAVGTFPAGPVLDLGCGPGQISQYLLARGRLSIGLDFAPRMLAEAARLVPRPGLVTADLLALPLIEGSCAAVIASYSLHHLPKSMFGDALAGISRVIRPGGLLVLITHGGAGEEQLSMPAGQLVLSHYAPGELCDRLTATGFDPELVRVRPPRPGEHPAEKIRLTARKP